MIWQKLKKRVRPTADSDAGSLSAHQLKGHRFLGKFRNDQQGATAVEFGLLALPFFAIIGATLETALVLLVTQIMENGVQDAGRAIRTGQAQGSGATLADFRTELCGNTLGMFDCARFHISVKTVTNFASASYTPPVFNPLPAPGSWVDPEVYQSGGGGCVVLINVHYRWTTLSGLLGFSLADTPGSTTRLMSGVSIFRNEPFGGSSISCGS